MEEKYTEITPNNRLLNFNFRELFAYKDLIAMYIKRDIVTFYKQTILGPLWFVIQPILTTVMFMFVFGNLAGISTDGIPGPLFYFAGIILWNYFADCLNRTSHTFTANQGVFGKVYFPRLVVPISVTLSNLVKFFIQFVIFLIIYLVYVFLKGAEVAPNWYAFLFPLLVVMSAGLALGFGIIFSSMTTKYRDLTFLLQFGVQLWMYATPVIYPLSTMPISMRWIFFLNPMTAIIESFKRGAIGNSVMFEGIPLIDGGLSVTESWLWLAYSFVFMLVVLLLGIIIFNKVEKDFMDTV
jgi:lipopolysaccharide transport system permease protein